LRRNPTHPQNLFWTERQKRIDLAEGVDDARTESQIPIKGRILVASGLGRIAIPVGGRGGNDYSTEQTETEDHRDTDS
jgi:hypothetical protein